jgi:hypothetical protein
MLYRVIPTDKNAAPRLFIDLHTLNRIWSTLPHKRLTKPSLNLMFIFLWRCGPTWATAFSCLRFLDQTQRHSTVGRTPLNGWSPRHRDFYLTNKHITHDRHSYFRQDSYILGRRAVADLRRRRCGQIALRATYSKFCKNSLMMVYWPKYVVKIKIKYNVVLCSTETRN